MIRKFLARKLIRIIQRLLNRFDHLAETKEDRDWLAEMRAEAKTYEGNSEREK
jgi:hypothetical protein